VFLWLLPLRDRGGGRVVREGRVEYIGEQLGGICAPRNLCSGADGGTRLPTAGSGLCTLPASLHAQFQSTSVVHTARISGLRPGAARHRTFTPVRPFHLCHTNTAFMYRECVTLCMLPMRKITLKPNYSALSDRGVK
jgi:hypothetical protein